MKILITGDSQTTPRTLSKFNAIPSPIEGIIQAMRSELEEYGGVLILLDQQQEAIAEGHHGLYCELQRMINTNLVTVNAGHADCEALVARLSPKPRRKDVVLDILALTPPPIRPLVAALSEETGRLRRLIPRRLRQNHAARRSAQAFPARGPGDGSRVGLAQTDRITCRDGALARC